MYNYYNYYYYTVYTHATIDPVLISTEPIIHCTTVSVLNTSSVLCILSISATELKWQSCSCHFNTVAEIDYKMPVCKHRSL